LEACVFDIDAGAPDVVTVSKIRLMEAVALAVNKACRYSEAEAEKLLPILSWWFGRRRGGPLR